MSRNPFNIDCLVYLVAVGLVALSGCAKSLDVDSLQTNIRENVIRQGGLSLKTVTCPKNVPLETGRAFDCVGELDSGELFAIPAKQTDATGKVEWDVPHTKGLLNLVKLESLFQETLQASEGKKLAIECGQGYRAVKPGESFECQIKQPVGQSTGKDTQGRTTKLPAKDTGSQQVKPTEPAKTILVTIDPENNVNWRQVVSVVSDKPVASQSSNVVASASQSASNPAPMSASSTRENLSEDVQKDLEERFD